MVFVGVFIVGDLYIDRGIGSDLKMNKFCELTF